MAKQNPDRTLSTEKRLIHDQRRVNETTDKEWHPPAAQPFHRQLARMIVWWSTMLPSIPILLSKLDVKGAFKLLWVDPADVGTFATDLPWRASAGITASARLPFLGTKATRRCYNAFRAVPTVAEYSLRPA